MTMTPGPETPAEVAAMLEQVDVETADSTDSAALADWTRSLFGE